MITLLRNVCRLSGDFAHVIIIGNLQKKSKQNLCKKTHERICFSDSFMRLSPLPRILFIFVINPRAGVT